MKNLSSAWQCEMLKNRAHLRSMEWEWTRRMVQCLHFYHLFPSFASFSRAKCFTWVHLYKNKVSKMAAKPLFSHLLPVNLPCDICRGLYSSFPQSSYSPNNFWKLRWQCICWNTEEPRLQILKESTLLTPIWPQEAIQITEQHSTTLLRKA